MEGEIVGGTNNLFGTKFMSAFEYSISRHSQRANMLFIFISYGGHSIVSKLWGRKKSNKGGDLCGGGSPLSHVILWELAGGPQVIFPHCKNEAIPPLHLCWDNGPCPPFLFDLCVLPHTCTHTQEHILHTFHIVCPALQNAWFNVICKDSRNNMQPLRCNSLPKWLHLRTKHCPHAYDLTRGGWKLCCCL